MSGDVIFADDGLAKPLPVTHIKGTKKKNETARIELAPMITHWKPTGQNCYRIDTKPTVIRRRDSMPAPPSPPRRLRAVDVVVSKPRPQAVAPRTTPATARELQAWSATSPRKSSDIWRPKSSSLDTPDSTEMVRRLRQQRYACADCSEGHCCQARGGPACVPECPCSLVLAWQELERSNPPTPRREVFTPDPTYVRAWSDVPRKCDPQVWLNVRRKPNLRVDQEGANFRWMGWDFVPDFTTAQSFYG